ncbi:MAG: PDZ domain-containing protein [Caldilineaceae bacterium SB0661_bin_32]|uniref:PDZ domain-containing protein n=1 Tax=Caldilineaceae bacterium SB0661_bin_32 TaxID=2605255 RepID=A0A6B1D985_9CHLR|nr:PDZ domain-containing protein [Caldilineaceae bacterium SB0661_bin_32]
MKARFVGRICVLLAATLTLGSFFASDTLAQESGESPPAAPIVNDEGGAVRISGSVTYSYPYFTAGVAQPLVILEDQAGFVDRNEHFLMPVESQTIGQITSDFFTSPFEYSLALPIEPQGSYRDVDNDSSEDQGVQVFAIAYWDNTFGDPFLEVRDLHGGGWSTAYASTRISDEIETEREIVGGVFLVYAPDAEQGFPSGFGEDRLLFTDDDPIVILPQGYTIVNLDAEPFSFDRSRNPVVDLIEPEGIALVDYSEQSYPDAFNSLIDLLKKEYAFTEYKGIDWEAKRTEFLPRFEAAAADGGSRDYQRALRDFSWSIPDGHVSGPFIREDFQQDIAGGLGIAIRETEEGPVIVNYVTEGSPAEEAGITLGTEIVSIDGVPIAEVISNAVAHSAPFSTGHFQRLQQMRYAVRFPIETEVELTWKDADGEEVTQTMKVIGEYDSFSFSSFARGTTGFEIPVDYKLLEADEYGENDYGYVKIDGFSDNSVLTVQLWERMIRTLKRYAVNGLIIDMRQNGGGSGFLADQMAAYFFHEPHVLGNTGYYDEDWGEFYFDPDGEDRFYLPAEDLRYDGEVAVIVGPFCASACEFFSYNLTIENRAAIVGHYPTGGLGGSIKSIKMPDDEYFTFTIGRAVDADGEIHIEGIGVVPTVLVPVTRENLLADEDDDVLLDAAVAHLDSLLAVETVDGGEIAIGDVITATLAAQTVVQYTLPLSEGDVISIFARSEDFDTYLALYLDGDSPIMTDDDSYDTDAALEELEVPSDLQLIVEVSSALGDEEGTYTLEVVDVSEEEADSDDG